MNVKATLVAAGWLLVGTSALLGRQPLPITGPIAGPAREHLPPPGDVLGEPLLDPTNDENFWSPPPMPPLPYGFTWDGYYGAEVEHDIYGYRRLNPPPRKTISCYGLFTGLADSVHVIFSYPTPNRPPPMYCPKGHGVPGKLSYGVRRHCSGGCTTCQSQPAPVVNEPALSAPQPVPLAEPTPAYPPQWTQPRIMPVQPRVAPVQPRVAPAQPQVGPVLPRPAPAQPLVPPVLVDEGLPAAPLATEDPAPAIISPMPPPPVLTEDPLPHNVVPAPATPLPRNKIPARN